LVDVKRDDLSDAARLQLFIDAVTDCAIFMLDPQGYVTSWNSGARRIKGYTAQEIVGQHFSRFYSEADRVAGELARALRTALESGRYEAEGWRIRKDGTPFWASVVIDPARDPHGVLIGYAKVTRDISDRRTAQLALARAGATHLLPKDGGARTAYRRSRARFQQSADDRWRPRPHRQTAVAGQPSWLASGGSDRNGGHAR
jgi:PAS domain S-box-containing protein